MLLKHVIQSRLDQTGVAIGALFAHPLRLAIAAAFSAQAVCAEETLMQTHGAAAGLSDPSFGGQIVTFHEPGAIDFGYLRSFGAVSLSGHVLWQDGTGHHYGHDFESMDGFRLEASMGLGDAVGTGAGFISLGRLTGEGALEDAEGTLLGIGMEFDIGSLQYLRAELQSTILQGQESGLEMENRRLAITAAFRF